MKYISFYLLSKGVPPLVERTDVNKKTVRMIFPRL